MALCALRMVALVQVGCTSLRTDGAWRTHVAAHEENRGDSVTLTPGARWVRRFAVPAPFTEVSDLAPTPRGLVLTTSIDVLTRDGAAVMRWTGTGTPQTVLHWEGQGFLRVHAWDNTLVVPDADAPFHTLPFLFDLDFDGYVFISSPDGTLSEHQREILPAVYHVFDVARLTNGRLVASTGAYPPSAIAYVSDQAPAALLVDDGPERPWRRLLEYPTPMSPGVFRFTFLLALPDGALLAATETPQGPGAVRIESAAQHPIVRVTEGITGYVLRWARWNETLFAIVQQPRETVLLVSTDGGRRFEPVDAPHMPQSIVVDGSTLYLLADGALHRATDARTFTEVVPRNEALRHVASSLLSAPLVAWLGSLWAASPRTGEVFEAR
jgi:hypothetical protein